MISPPDQALKAKLFRGLADASRLAVLEALRDGPRCVSEVVAATRLSQPNASGHLACLGDCGLVSRERRGKFVYYAIADKRVVQVLEEVEGILAETGRPSTTAPATRRARAPVVSRAGLAGGRAGGGHEPLDGRARADRR
jgi:ArsR family transcriptional regulator, cadmium/lead-responsive transcriptional repressor